MQVLIIGNIRRIYYNGVRIRISILFAYYAIDIKVFYILLIINERSDDQIFPKHDCDILCDTLECFIIIDYNIFVLEMVTIEK